jgi:hypothetical protein
MAAGRPAGAGCAAQGEAEGWDGLFSGGCNGGVGCCSPRPLLNVRVTRPKIEGWDGVLFSRPCGVGGRGRAQGEGAGAGA